MSGIFSWSVEKYARESLENQVIHKFVHIIHRGFKKSSVDNLTQIKYMFW